MKSHVTTKQGDSGNTRSLGGDICRKSDTLMEATGWLDSLRAQLALLRLQILASDATDREELAAFLWWLIHVCFLMGAQISDPTDKKPEYRPDELGPRHLERLEKEQQRLEAGLQLGRSFIASASTLKAAQADITATVCRTLERNLVRLQDELPEFRGGALMVFTNRLSDYLFILARHLENGHHLPVDYKVL